jgi:hypothetical protein
MGNSEFTEFCSSVAMINVIFACFPIQDIKLMEVIPVSSSSLQKVFSGKNDKLEVKPHKSETEELSVIPNSTQKRKFSKYKY